jgi:hypothetical protein
MKENSVLLDKILQATLLLAVEDLVSGLPGLGPILGVLFIML